MAVKYISQIYRLRQLEPVSVTLAVQESKKTIICRIPYTQNRKYHKLQRM